MIFYRVLFLTAGFLASDIGFAATQKAIQCEHPFRVQFFGDVFVSEKHSTDLENLFSGVSSLLKSSQVNVVNLEGVLSKHTERAFPTFPFSLKMNEDVARSLKDFGVQYATRANNHSMDFGLKGLEDTNRFLVQQGIQWTGVGKNIDDALKPILIEREGVKLGILAFTTTLPKEAWATSKTAGVAYPTPKRLRDSIKSLRSQADYVIVVFHWGEERSRKVRPHQVNLAEIAIDAGADSVVGHHAHVAQNIEKFSDKWIFYGLGNFVFTTRSMHADLGLGVRYDFCSSGIKESNETLQRVRPPEVSAILLDTLNTRTGFVTKPVLKSDLPRVAKSYFDNQLFSSEMIFTDK
jgi:poly-gamma-glutamate capsule biosynthesis protein CapA/YwtB (metallophosphatase superfamily)